MYIAYNSIDKVELLDKACQISLTSLFFQAKKFDEITNRLDFLSTIQNGHVKDQNTSNNISDVTDKKQSESPSRKESPQKVQTSGLAEPADETKIKQIEVRKLSTSSSSTSSVESFSKKLEKSGLMSPDDEKKVYANMSGTSATETNTAGKKQNEKEKKENFVLKKPSYSSSSSDEGF